MGPFTLKFAVEELTAQIEEFAASTFSSSCEFMKFILPKMILL